MLRKAMRVAALPAVVFRCMRIVRKLPPACAIGVSYFRPGYPGWRRGSAFRRLFLNAARLTQLPAEAVHPVGGGFFSDAASHFGRGLITGCWSASSSGRQRPRRIRPAAFGKPGSGGDQCGGGRGNPRAAGFRNCE